MVKLIHVTSGSALTPAEINLAVQVATDYRYDGRMKREGIAWFPPVWDQVQHFLRKGKPPHASQQPAELRGR